MIRLVNRVFLALGILVLFVLVLGFIGVRWGLTPIPKPPPGVRLEPLLPPITAADLKPDNGAYDYAKAIMLIQAHRWSGDLKDQIEAAMVGVFDGDINALEQTLREAQPALELVRKGSRETVCQMPEIDVAKDTNTLSSLRQLARLLIADGKWTERQGDASRAFNDYLITVKFGTDCGKGGTILHAMVGYAIVGMGTQALRAWVLQRANSGDDLRAVREKLDAIAVRAVPFAETLRYELAFAKEQIHDTAFVEAKPWWRPFDESVTFHCFDAAYGEIIQDAERPFWENHARAIEDQWDIDCRHRWFWMFDRPFPRILLGMMLPAIQFPRIKSVRANVELQATSVICALKSYELEHGSPPESLTVLVPDLLPAVPMDPFDGKPLRYRRESNEWVLWSVGSDMKDDNANWHEYKYRMPTDERRGGDIYFKSTEPQDDLAFYLSRQKLKSDEPVPSRNTPIASP